MKYPIDTEKYIADMRAEFGPHPAAEHAHREIIPFVNTAYEDGLNGEDGYPLDIGEELQRFSEASGHPIETVRANGLLPPLLRWLNSAYAQGQRDTKEVMPC